MKKLVIISIILISCAHLANAQTNDEIEFGYDLSGNRVLRQVVSFKIIENSYADSTDADFQKLEFIQKNDYSEKIGDYRVSIFPNPTTGLIKIVINSTDEISNASIYLHTISGIEIYFEDKISNVTQLDIREKENGAYILTVLIGSKNKSWKIIKN